MLRLKRTSLSRALALDRLELPDLVGPALVPTADNIPAQAGEDLLTAEIIRDFDEPFLELLRLLREAAEVEHSLMLQYLYAGFSVRIPKYLALMGTGGNKPSAEPFDLMGVAIEEMVHLNMVNSFLKDLGCVPHWDRQDFPFETDIYPFPLSLEPLSPESLAKYCYVEAPRWAVDPAHPDNQSGENREFIELMSGLLGSETAPNQLGSLYSHILTLIEETAAKHPGLIPDVARATATFTALKDEGEGEHFRFFRGVLLARHPSLDATVLGFDPWSLARSDPNYPSLPLPVDPSCFDAEEKDPAQWLSNLHYWSVLMLLDFSFRQSDGRALQLARDHMTGGLRPLGLHLAGRGTGVPFDRLSMGYSLGLNRTATALSMRLLQAEIRTWKARLGSPVRFYANGLADATDSYLQSVSIP